MLSRARHAIGAAFKHACGGQRRRHTRHARGEGGDCCGGDKPESPGDEPEENGAGPGPRPDPSNREVNAQSSLSFHLAYQRLSHADAKASVMPQLVAWGLAIYAGTVDAFNFVQPTQIGPSHPRGESCLNLV